LFGTAHTPAAIAAKQSLYGLLNELLDHFGALMKTMSRAILLVVATVGASVTAAQTSYPEKPIRMVVGFPPGSLTDSVARLFGQKLGEALGKPTVVENIPGAGGTIAAERLAKAAPDAYTLGLFGQAQLVINPNLYKPVAYDAVKDFAPVSQVTVSAMMLVVHNACR